MFNHGMNVVPVLDFVETIYDNHKMIFAGISESVKANIYCVPKGIFQITGSDIFGHRQIMGFYQSIEQRSVANVLFQKL